MPEGLRLALSTFTVLPVRAGAGRPDRRSAGTAVSLGPLVGLGLGVVAAAVLLAFRLVAPAHSPALLACALTIATLALLTRGLHLDGLADSVDGLASYLPPEQARAVMRRPDLGPLGMVAVCLSLLVQVSALLACALSGRGTVSLLLAASGARLAVAAACTRATPAATRDGLGAAVAGTVPSWVVSLWTAILITGSAAFGALDGGGTDRARALDAARPVLALLVALWVARVVRRHAVRRFGGLTGDVLGALVEVTTTVVLVVMALDLPVYLQQHLHAIQPT